MSALCVTITALKSVVVVALLGAATLQLVVMPWSSQVMAADYPEAAGMRWPVLLAAVAGLGCGEVVLVALWRLLGAVTAGRIFDPRSYRWVDLIIAALGTGTVLSVGMTIYLAWVGLGPISVPGAALVCAVGGVGGLLLMLVMRALLHQATTLRSEMDGVI